MRSLLSESQYHPSAMKRAYYRKNLSSGIDQDRSHGFDSLEFVDSGVMQQVALYFSEVDSFSKVIPGAHAVIDYHNMRIAHWY